MKVTLELLGVEQFWSPDTNTHTNKVYLKIGEEVLEVAVTEEQVAALISDTAGQQHAVPEQPTPEPSTFLPAAEPAFEPVPAVEGDRIFGGAAQTHAFEPLEMDTSFLPAEEETHDPPPSATQMRKSAIRERVETRPTEQHRRTQKDKLKELRTKAARMPRPRVRTDDAGNPVVPQAGPVIHRHVPEHVDTMGDDVGFEQG